MVLSNNAFTKKQYNELFIFYEKTNLYKEQKDECLCRKSVERSRTKKSGRSFVFTGSKRSFGIYQPSNRKT